MIKFLAHKLLATLASFLLVTAIHAAGTPMWTFTPLTPTSFAVAINEEATVRYLVTNQSHYPHQLRMKRGRGLRQTGVCNLAPTGTPGDTCIIGVTIIGSALPTSGISGGPVLCQTNPNGLPNSNQCYEPCSTNGLNITLLPNIPTLGGTITGLRGTVTLEVNGANPEAFSSDGPFTLSTIVVPGSPYNVTVGTQPAGELCTVINGRGIMPNTPVTNIMVICSNNAFTIGGTVTGLLGAGLVLQNIDGQQVPIAANGPYTFPVPIANGSPYLVTVASQPAGPAQTCTVTNASGEISGTNVTNIDVFCSATTFSIGGTISGLSGASAVTLVNNGNDFLTLQASGTYAFTFPTRVAAGSPYNVTVATQPLDRTCTVSNGSGVATSDVITVVVNCVNDITTLSVNPTKLIVPINDPAGGGIQVTNTGTSTARNVHAVLPEGWDNVTVINGAGNTNCTQVLPGETCKILLTSTLPYVAKYVVITADNVRNPPSVAVGFSIAGNLFYGWKPNAPTIAMTVLPLDSATSMQWSPGFYREVCGINEDNLSAINVCTSSSCGGAGTCDGGIDGLCDTTKIRACLGVTSTDYAAKKCVNLSTPSNSVYLPAACQFGPNVFIENNLFGANVCNNAPNIQNNLVAFGLGTFNTNAPYWNSTQSSYNSLYEAWFEVFNFGEGVPLQDVGDKVAFSSVRCGTEFPFP